MNRLSKILVIVAAIVVLGLSVFLIYWFTRTKKLKRSNDEEFGVKNSNNKRSFVAPVEDDFKLKKEQAGDWRNDSDKRIKFSIWNAMYRDWARLATALDIKYHQIAGNLLGIVRDGELMQWDSDMDIAVSNEDVDKLISYASRNHDGEATLKFRSERGSKFFLGDAAKPVPGGRFRMSANLPEHMVQIFYTPSKDDPEFTPEMHEYFNRHSNSTLWHIDIVSPTTTKACPDPWTPDCAYTSDRVRCDMGGIQTWCPKDAVNRLAAKYGKNWIMRPYCRDRKSNEWLQKGTPALARGDYTCF